MCAALATVLESAIQPHLSSTCHFFPFYAAVALVAWLGGTGPGVFALVAGYLAEDWFVIQPHHLEILSPSLSDLADAGAYASIGLIIIAVIDRMRRTGDKARRAAEQARIDRDRLEAVLKQMPVGVIIAEAPSRNLLIYNDQAEEILGHPLSAPSSEGHYHIVQGFHPDGRPYQTREWPLARSLAEGTTVKNEEIQLLRSDGTRPIILVNSAPIRDKEGKIISAVMSLQDITERKKAEEARAQLASIVENSDDAFISLALDGTIATWNQGARLIFGYAAGEVIGKSVSILLPPERLGEDQNFLETFRQEQGTYRYEMVRMRKDEKRIHVAFSVAPIRDEGGQTTGISLMARDITARKHAEESLRQAKEQLSRHAEVLEGEVTERTAKLQETSQSLEGVCYHIAHDLRAPLRAMQGFSTALLETYSEELEEPGQDFLRRIAVAANRMNDLIQDLLEFGKLGHMSVAPGWVNLDSLVKTVLAAFSEEIAAKGATVELHQPLPQVWAADTLLEQVLTNLISNGLKFVAPAVAPRIQIWADLEDRSASIFVKDNGLGIPWDQQQKIFGVFERLYSPRKFPGTGIGLAIVQKAVQRMGGEVRVESQPGQGSCFSVILPKPEERRLEIRCIEPELLNR